MLRYFKPRKVINKKKKQIIEEKIPNEDPLYHEDYRYKHTLLPPYNIILDTNFIAQSIGKKLDIKNEILKCLCSNVNIWIPQCVFAELGKLGTKHRVSLSVVKNLPHEVLICDHKGTYADDCIVERVSVHRCYVVATCDTGLKQRIRKVPGVPIMFIRGHKYEVEGMIV